MCHRIESQKIASRALVTMLVNTAPVVLPTQKLLGATSKSSQSFKFKKQEENMILRTTSAIVLTATMVLVFASVASADVYQVNYAGTVTGVTGNLLSGFSNGQSLTGSMLFESTTTPELGGTVNSAVFNAVLSHSISINGGATSYSALVPFSNTGKAEIQIDNAGGGFPNDRYALLSRASQGLAGANVNGLPLFNFGIRFDDSTNSVFSTALVLPTNISLNNFNSNSFFMFFGNNFTELVSGNMTSMSMSVSSVPEPGTACLFAIGSILMSLCRVRLKR